MGINSVIRKFLKKIIPSKIIRTYRSFKITLNLKYRGINVPKKDLNYLLNYEGMVSQNERLNLIELARKTKGNIVEFGVYLGASTACLAYGLKLRNNSSDENNENLDIKVYAFDSFSCPIDHPFSRQINRDSRLLVLDELLEIDKENIEWHKLSLKLLNPLIEYIYLKKITISRKKDFPEIPENISILHLDLPKDLDTFKIISSNTFGNLKKGSKILFQDFAYHFSGDLIALFTFLVENSALKFIEIVDTTGVFEVVSLKKLNIQLKSFYSLDEIGLLNCLDRSKITSSQVKGYSQYVDISLRFAYIERLINKMPNDLNNIQNLIRKTIEIGMSKKLTQKHTSFILSEILTEKVIVL